MARRSVEKKKRMDTEGFGSVWPPIKWFAFCINTNTTKYKHLLQASFDVNMTLMSQPLSI